MTDPHRYGIGEWYGKLFTKLSSSERSAYAQIGSSKKHKNLCPFINKKCTKQGGVCSLRLYSQTKTKVRVSIKNPELVTLCPYRFWDGNKIFHWVNKHILKSTQNAVVVKEVGFLDPITQKGVIAGSRKVGKIDMAIVDRSSDPLKWCALELQAVYFSGDKMKDEFDALKSYHSSRLIFPAGNRRPDFRSSGPKRLMPQLQIKVPTLRRWGKKMAVVVDKSFFNSLGPMDRAKHLSNADIAWFIVDYDTKGTIADILLKEVYLTTLERAVEGLTAGEPVSLEEFETDLKDFTTNNKHKKKIICHL